MSTVGGGNRRAERVRKPSRDRRGALAAAVAFLVAAGTVALAGTHEALPPTGSAVPTTVPVTDLVRGCPGTSAPGANGSTVLLGSAPVAGLQDAGRVRVAALGRPGADEADQDLGRGELVSLDDGAGRRSSLVVSATDEIAAGLFAHQVDVREADGTAAAVPCPQPASSWWFTGAGGTLAHGSELVVANVDAGPAVVDVSLHGPDGRVDTVGTRGLTIEPGEQTVLDLTEIAPQAEELSVHVETNRGRVVAAVSDAYSPGFAGPGGAEWIPAQPIARRTVRLAGLPVRATDRNLLVANPTEREALVAVEVSGDSGAFVPEEVAEVRVPPGTVVSTDLGDAVPAGGSAMTLRSNVPVTATIRSEAADDTAYAAPVRNLAGPAAAPLVTGSRSSVLLSAGSDPATARVTTYTADGDRVESEEVEIAATATTRWRPQRRASYLVVDPTSGQVSGALAVRAGGGVTQLPLTTLPVTVDQPVVSPAPR